MVERVFEAKLDKLDDVMAFVEGELEKYDCPMKKTMTISVAVEEIFVNVAHYAYRDSDKTGDVQVSVSKNDDDIIIGFIDSGKPFNPLLREDPDVTLSAEDRKIGGLGIYMVKQSMDDVTYEFRDGNNILHLIKKI